MTDTPIVVEGLGKRYRISHAETHASTVAGTLGAALRAPFRYLREMTRPPREDEILWALRDVSFAVKRGEVLGIIGQNGAGKSTLLKILSRITDPTEGRAVITGRVGSLLEVGTGFNHELTGRENIYLSGTILGMKRSEVDRKFDEIVAFAGVEQFLDTPVKRYSSGMNVRLGFAVAAHLEPEVLIVDEVLSVGDATFQRKSLGKMENIAGEGRTILFVSHSMPAIQAFCHRVIRMSRGRIIQEGTPAEVIGRYLDDGLTEESSGAVVDLKQHPNRTTLPENALMTGFRILDEDGQPSKVFRMGQRVRFEVTMETGARVLPNALISIIVEKRGVQVCHLSTRYMAADPVVLKGHTVVSCEWDLGDLSPGHYMVADVLVKEYTGAERLDAIKEVASFEIAASDRYGTGRLPVENPVVMPPGQWSVSTDKAPTPRQHAHA